MKIHIVILSVLSNIIQSRAEIPGTTSDLFQVIADATWEYYYQWDCNGGNNGRIAAPSWTDGGEIQVDAVAKREECAQKCLETSTCIAFNYPDTIGASSCFLKAGESHQKSTFLGKDCGGAAAYDYYTLVTRTAWTPQTMEQNGCTTCITVSPSSSATESPSASPSSLNVTRAYDITAESATTNSDNSVSIVHKVGRLVTNASDVAIVPHKVDCETVVTPGDGQVITDWALGALVNSGITLSFNIDTTELVGSNLLLNGDEVEGTIGFCLRATTYETLTFLDGSKESVAMISQRTNYSISYSGSDQGITLNDILMGEQAIIEETIENALSDLTLSTYLCSSDSLEPADMNSAQVDSMFVCIKPSSALTYVELKRLTASYGVGQATTMTFISVDDNFNIGLTPIEILRDENRSILRIQIPVLAQFLEGGDDKLNVGGRADVGFEQQDRQNGKIGREATIDFGMTVTIGTQVEEESGCMDVLAGMLSGF